MKDDLLMEVPRPSSSDEIASLRKRKAKWRLISLAVAVIVIGGGFWYFERSFSLPFRQIASFESSLSYKLADSFVAPSPSIETSTPAKRGNNNLLTPEGVIAQTNKQRGENGGLPALTENATLDDIAMLRLDDMFSKQYFAHVDPVTGSSAQTVASSVGYVYLALGENLALGNFGGDAGVVTAWMNSPGHRANILDIHYSQIGVAVRQGNFQGQTTWIAVQVFGKPSSDCPSADAAMKAYIDASEAQIVSTSAQLQQSKANIDAMSPQSGLEYNQKVADYNTAVQQYNYFVAQTKAKIAQYNSEVASFNACLGG